MKILGIETSCDETAVAIIDDKKNVLANKILSQIDIHQKFGGVVPEIAARSHVEFMPKLLEEALSEASVKLKDIDAIGATGGPGLIAGVMVGIIYAKTIASVINRRFIAINHLEGHALVARMTQNIDFPYLLLLISGGHCQTIIIEELGKYHTIGTTLDDAVGEAFDKVAKLLGLGYPGGPMVEKFAKNGNEKAYEFPKPMMKKENYNFSFSGLKTAVKNKIIELGNLDQEKKYNICASFQYTIVKILTNKLIQSAKLFDSKFPNIKNVVISGGVAANSYIRSELDRNMVGYNLFYPPINLCTDNAVMIAYAAHERLSKGYSSDLGFEPKSRWNLSEISY